MNLGDRMKFYEGQTEERLMPMLPVIARLDGRGFSKFTKGLTRPYDFRLHDLMVEVTKYLVENTHAVTGYTQSDEITLAWFAPDFESEVFFGGRIQKMVSTLAAMASVKFVYHLPDFLPEKAGKLPTFDCRVFSVPTLSEACNAFLWREQDATKNSVSMAAQHYYSHNELMNKHQGEMQEMLFQKGVNWNDYPAFFKRGTYLQRKTVSRCLSDSDVASLPAKHHLRILHEKLKAGELSTIEQRKAASEQFGVGFAGSENMQLYYIRSEVVKLDLPILSTIPNREEILFPKK